MNNKKLLSEIHRIHNLMGVKEKFNEGRYDLVSQFKGDHHGNPMGKNEFLNSLGLDEQGIERLQDIVNVMTDDKVWYETVYPEGTTISNLIQDISRVIIGGDLKRFITDNSHVSPIKISNHFKRSIERLKK
jgi:hypothetical protein